MPAITDEQRQQVLRLHRNGEGRNAIAATVGISAGSVTKICHDAGLSFDRAATEQATKSRKADLAARRAELELHFVQDAARLREQLWQPATYRQLGKFADEKGEGGSGGRQWTEVVEWTQPTPTYMDQLKIVQAASTAVAAAQRISDSAANVDNDHAKSMLGQLMLGLGEKFRETQAADL